MKTLITLILVFTLTGCNNSNDYAYNQARGFFWSDCNKDSYRVTQTDEGKMRTITVTCTR